MTRQLCYILSLLLALPPVAFSETPSGQFSNLSTSQPRFSKTAGPRNSGSRLNPALVRNPNTNAPVKKGNVDLKKFSFDSEAFLNSIDSSNPYSTVIETNGSNTSQPASSNSLNMKTLLGAGSSSQRNPASVSSGSAPTNSGLASPTTRGGDGGDGISIGVDEFADEGGETPVAGPTSGPGAHNKNRTPPANPGGGGSIQELAYFKPLCFLFDPAVSDANEIVKKTVDHYASCGVVAVPYSFTLKPGSYDPEAVEKNLGLMPQVCNLNEIFGVKESSVQLHPNSKTASDRMCDQYEDEAKTKPKTNTAGCAVLIPPREGAGYSMNDEQLKKFTEQAKSSNSEHGSRTGKAGEEGLSMVDLGAGWDVAVHEFQHNVGGVNTGDGNGKEQHGFAIESPGKKVKGQDSGKNFTDIGCQYLRAASNVNDRGYKWDPDRNFYYQHIDEDKFRWDMNKGESFFEGPGTETPPGVEKPPPRPPTGPPLIVDNGPAKQPETGLAAEIKSSSNSFFEGIGNDSKHPDRKQELDSPSRDVASVGGLTDEDEFFDTGDASGEGSLDEGSRETTSFGFDEDAEDPEGKKTKGKPVRIDRPDRDGGGFGNSLEGGVVSIRDKSRGPEGESKSGTSLGFDEDAKEEKVDADKFLNSLASELTLKTPEEPESEGESVLDENFFSKPKPNVSREPAGTTYRKPQVIGNIYK